MTTAADHPPPPPPEKDPKDKELAELKDKYERAMADAEGYGAKLNEMSAAHQKLGEKLMAMRGRLAAMAGIEDAEGAEDVAIERLQAIVDDLRASQKAEAEELAKKAASAHGLSEAPASIERLTSLVLSDRAGFLEMYPRAVAPADPAALPKQPPAGGAQGATGALLTTRVTAGAQPGATVTMSDRQTPAERSKRVNARADVLLSEGKARDTTEALLMADRELARDVVAPFVAAPRG